MPKLPASKLYDENEFRFWGAIDKRDGYIRSVEQAEGKEQASKILFSNVSFPMRKWYEIKPVMVTIDTATQQAIEQIEKQVEENP